VARSNGSGGGQGGSGGGQGGSGGGQGGSGGGRAAGGQGGSGQDTDPWASDSGGNYSDDPPF